MKGSEDVPQDSRSDEEALELALQEGLKDLSRFLSLIFSALTHFRLHPTSRKQEREVFIFQSVCASLLHIPRFFLCFTFFFFRVNIGLLKAAIRSWKFLIVFYLLFVYNLSKQVYGNKN